MTDRWICGRAIRPFGSNENHVETNDGGNSIKIHERGGKRLGKLVKPMAIRRHGPPYDGNRKSNTDQIL